MPRINVGRVVLGGVVAAALWGLLYAPVHPLVEVHNNLGRPVLPITPFRGATPLMRVLIVINGFVQGITTVWLYAGIRPRFGPGPKTAAMAVFAVWVLVGWLNITWAVFTGAPLAAVLLPVTINLPLVLLAGMAGAWLYKE
jgi:hypothetical protein